MSKNIGIFSLAYPPFVGGAELAVKEIISRLPDFHFEVFTHDFKKYGFGKLAKFFYIFRAWRSAEAAHRQSPFSVIWAIMAAYGGIAALLFKIRHPSVPLLLTLQEGDSEEHILKRVGIFYPIWRMIFKKADHIQVISNYLADFARRHGARCPIEVIPNGVALEQFDVRSVGNVRAVGDRTPIIITTSRLVHKNGIDTLIRAMVVIAIPQKREKQSPGDRHGLRPRDDIKLQILGGGPDEQKLKNLAAELGVADKINFLGHIEPEFIPEYLAKADVFVRPSRSEGLGSSFLEAMAAGLPIIGTNVGGIPDFLQDGQTGLFCKVGDPQDLAKKIKILFTDNKLRSRIAQNGQKLVLEKYSWDIISSKMKNIFQNIITNYQVPSTRLLVATGIYPPDIGGPATYTVLLEKELPKRGIAVGVLPFTDYRKKLKIVRHLSYFRDCWKLAKGFNFVYAQDPVSVGLPAMLAAKLRGKKFFIRVAGDYAWEQSVQRFGVGDSIDEFQNKKYNLRTELLRWIQKWVVGNADLVITPSKYFQKLVSGWVKNRDKVKVIYNGIQLGDPKSEIRNPKQIQNSKFKTIISAGRLVPWKGFDVLIEIMRDLPDWKLVIVGDGPEKEKLQLLVTNYKLQDRVNLWGAVSREKLLEYLSQAEIFVLNTSFESFSFQLVEAMAAGVPVIATNIGNLAEIIENGKEGILIEPNNKEQIVAAIQKIASDDNFRKMIIKNAKEKAEQFSISRTVDNLVELINSHGYTSK